MHRSVKREVQAVEVARVLGGGHELVEELTKHRMGDGAPGDGQRRREGNGFDVAGQPRRLHEPRELGVRHERGELGAAGEGSDAPQLGAAHVVQAVEVGRLGGER